MQGKTKQLITLVGAMTAISLTTPALALMSAADGWYLEGNVGSTKLTNKSYPGSASTSGIGGNVNLGYKFMPYIATELGYTRYANTGIKVDNTNVATDRHYSYNIAIKGILPITTSGFELFGKVGAERVNSSVSYDNGNAGLAQSVGLGDTSHSHTGVYLGAGGQYYFMPEAAIVGQWQVAQGSSATGTMALLSIGMSFIFD